MARHILLNKIDNGGSNISLARTVASVIATEDKQKIFTIPISNFNKNTHFFDVRIGSVWISDERYDIVNNTIVLKENEEGIDVGRKIWFVFTYLQEGTSSTLGKAVLGE